LPLLLATCLALCGFPALAERIQDLPQPTDYVSDFAHVLSPETVARLDSLCEQLDHSQADAKLAVVTVNNLDGNEASDYANQLEDHWKMGSKKGQNRYAMVLLAVSDHKYRIEIGYGLEGILPDAKTGDIGRAMVPELRAGNYDGAVTLATSQVAQAIADDAKVTLTQDAQAAAPQPQRHGGGFGRLLLLIIILVFFGGFALLRMLFGWGLFFGGWGGGGGFGGGGGGNDGGGFGGFGGDGGGFGGGGAGGSW